MAARRGVPWVLPHLSAVPTIEAKAIGESGRERAS